MLEQARETDETARGLLQFHIDSIDAQLAGAQPMNTPKTTYTKGQREIWRKEHRDYKSGTLRGGDAMVLKWIPSKGTCLVGLEELGDDGELLEKT